MRLLILATAAALTLAACKNNDQHDNTTNVDENLTAENIVSNDVTAIDAVTGDAANMAADVNYADIPGGNTTTNAVAPSSGPPANRAATPRPKPTTTTAAPTSAAPSNATANAQ